MWVPNTLHALKINKLFLLSPFPFVVFSLHWHDFTFFKPEISQAHWGFCVCDGKLNSFPHCKQTSHERKSRPAVKSRGRHKREDRLTDWAFARANSLECGFTKETAQVACCKSLLSSLAPRLANHCLGLKEEGIWNWKWAKQDFALFKAAQGTIPAKSKHTHSRTDSALLLTGTAVCFASSSGENNQYFMVCLLQWLPIFLMSGHCSALTSLH